MSDVGIPYSGNLADRWCHYSGQILIGAIVSAIVLGLRPLSYENPLALFVPVLLFAWVITGGVLMRRHDTQLCEQCLTEMPLNAAEVATRYERRFAVTHLSTDPRMIIGYLIFLVASNLSLAATNVLPFPIEQVLWASCQTTMIYLILAHSTHRRLQPWCRRCDSGGGPGRSVNSDGPAPIGSQHG